MKFFKRIQGFFLLLTILSSCGREDSTIVVSEEDYHRAVDLVTAIQVHDIFSPPVSSRIYAYSHIAAYEAMRTGGDTYISLANSLNEFPPIDEPLDTAGLNPRVASLVAFYEVAQNLIFSEERIVSYKDSLYNSWNQQNPKSFEKSKAYGLAVAEKVKFWMSKDNYAQTRTMPKFSVYSEDESRWQPTPPTYMDGIEPHWGKMRPFVVKDPAQFKPVPPPAFSLEPGSRFYRELMEVYSLKEEMNEQGDSSEMVQIAKFWDCNPYVSTQKGHLMFATKKITPGGHWMGITKIACRKDNADFERTIYAYTKTAIAIADSFIVCWDEKYRSNLIRPETLINRHIDDNWAPLLQTPPFPEYTSGHSVVSTAAAIVLTDIFGENFVFDDDTEVAYGLPVRRFNSFKEASVEAANSRLFGGIHYRSAIEVGMDQGQKVGEFVLSNLQMTTAPTKDLALSE